MNNVQNLHTEEEDAVPFGTLIANDVADQLQNGHFLGYRHRDYCGMGMQSDENQRFFYGEIYDGDLNNPKIFENRDLFVSWLSMQSTASLARLDDEEFYKGNQVITRKRLLEFIQ
ncbi:MULTISPECIES: hypothetical protein [Chryseobacterium]|uniref:hypothetical protein n=1 Tax=Chryseobacterium TaxID=59732 RepID=UPI00129695AD|nr:MULTISPECIES: hypothetical protein [Chryseobacterium]MDR6920343.1 hypothetical protein [Chryseobacterium sp. 2987]